MTDYILGYDNWKSEYLSLNDKNKIWIYLQLHDGNEVYLRDHKAWLSLKNDPFNSPISKVGLRFRSHLISVDTSCSDGVYLVQSLKGEFGGSSKHCFTIGVIKNNVVDKSMWITPELVQEETYEDSIDNCFEEAIIWQKR